jgi:hypothetical protein
MLSNWRNYKIYAVFFVFCFACYFNTVSNEFGLDDANIFAYIPKQGSNFTDIFDVFGSRYEKNDYRPVSLFTFAAEQYFLGEINTTFSHTINILLFFFLCCLLYSNLVKLPISNIQTIAFVTVLIFISHPVHAGVVNSLKSRDNLLSMIFVFLALKSYLNYEEHKQKTALLKVVLFFIIGLMCKLDAINLIFILPAISFIVYERKWKRTILLFVVFFFIYTLFFNQILNYFIPIEDLTSEQTVMYTENPLPYINSIWSTTGLTVITIWKYLSFMLIPTGYYFYFGYNQIPVLPLYNLLVLFKLAVIISILLTALFMYKKEKLLSLSIFLFFATLAYCANLIIPVQGIVADRYAFIASFWFCAALAILLIRISSSPKITSFFGKKITRNKILVPVLLVILLLNISFLISRNNAWKNTLTLIETDMPYLKESFEANRIAATTYINRAMQSSNNLSRQNYFIKGLQYSKQANSVYSENIYTNESEGIAYYGLRNIPSAEKQFKKTIQQFDTSAVSWDILGDITFSRKNYDSAALCYYNLIRVEPLNESAYYKYPNALYKASREDSALAFTTQLIVRNPDIPLGYESTAYLYFNHGDTLQGLDFIEIAFEKGMNNKNAYQYFTDIRKRYPKQKKQAER